MLSKTTMRQTASQIFNFNQTQIIKQLQLIYFIVQKNKYSCTTFLSKMFENIKGVVKLINLLTHQQKKQETMRINQSKSRRFSILEQISLREQSRQKFRKSSAERRKKIEQSLGDFMKTMSDVSYRQTEGSEAFKVNRMDEEGKLHLQIISPGGKSSEPQYNEPINSPSFQDIKISDELKSGQEIRTERYETIQKGQHNGMKQMVYAEREMKEPQQQDGTIRDEQIVYNNRQVKKIERSGRQLAQNNISIASSSGIFFTSQFNDFINQNHLQPIPQTTTHNHPLCDSQHQTTLMKEQQTQTNPIKQHLQQSKINQQSQNSYENAQPGLAILSNIQLQRQQQQQQQQHDFSNNKSTHSLAFSNQSSLKYSLNQSHIRTIINQKFAHQLIILQANQFSSEHEPSSLLLQLKLQILVDRFHANLYRSTMKDLKVFFKMYHLSRAVIKRLKRTGFQAFLINQQLNLLDKKNQIKSQQFIESKQQQKTQAIFFTLKQLFLILPTQKLQQAAQHYHLKQHQQTQKIFRCLKIVWFDQKVKKQIDLYYLSKLFAHFSTVLKNEKQQNRKKYLSFYCFNLKKRFFKLLKQGVDKSQIERIQRDNAGCHYSYVIMRKVFDAWRDRLAYKDRYISLAMTTKNTFKETSDQRWMQIKTVDFRQIK